MELLIDCNNKHKYSTEDLIRMLINVDFNGNAVFGVAPVSELTLSGNAEDDATVYVGGATPYDAIAYKSVSLFVNWSGLDATDAIIKIQQSADGIVWADMVDMNWDLDTATGVQVLTDYAFAQRFLQVVYDHGSNTDGDISVFTILK